MKFKPVKVKAKMAKFPSSRFDRYEDLSAIGKGIYDRTPESDPTPQAPLDLWLPRHRERVERDWSTYGAAMSREKLMCFKIINDAIEALDLQERPPSNGRPSVAVKDIFKCLCLRMYSNLSTWRSNSDLQMAKAMGFLENVYERTTFIKYMQDSRITSLLHLLATVIAKPLSAIETKFAIDATGISEAYGNDHWIKARENHKIRRQYRKLHIISGVKTNIITQTAITHGTRSDSPELPGLVQRTCDDFKPEEVSADVGYISRKNVKAIVDAGVIPYIRPKKNVYVPRLRGNNNAWTKMLIMWKHHQYVFAMHYNKRQNVESTFSMFKRRFGECCRTKKPISQENEIMCKIVCHNAGVLSHVLLSYDVTAAWLVNPQTAFINSLKPENWRS